MAKSGTKTCDCTAQGGTGGKVPCQCTNSQWFNSLPERWICDKCSQGKHQWW